ncbi:SepM family pheromone-processing serine protease [Bacillus weihaiensis]|uniref:endopeptidase La n=1 Tax=Bacillus weihaiensis TaxID=1547283 RepID=A0A1L3MSU1_9BACI|nr:SepM family pheromone-processing serine protease [Bacillus weihaiensis]APH05364.1 hypothetical protein A9C19_11715 [Bacillus weihaiensis]
MTGRTAFRVSLLLAIILLITTFIKLPYYVTQPGMASELKPIIKVEEGFDKEEGSFSLTTIRFGRANPLTYLWAKLNEYHYIHPLEEIKREEETDEDYLNRQLHMMEVSQESAITVAYQKAKKEITTTYNGVYVDGIIDGMPAANRLEVGDRIYKVNKKELETAEEFIEYVSAKKEGDNIVISFERDGRQMEESIKLAVFKDQPNKVGLGISLVTDREVEVHPEITLNTHEIGGPSAGLMLSLEIYNQLIEEDITKGYKIAGTGTINSEGIVGPIGGISQKIVTADKEGIEIFFAPNEENNPNSDYKEALSTGKEINTKMKIVPIDTFSDAVNYLMKLEEKG